MKRLWWTPWFAFFVSMTMLSKMCCEYAVADVPIVTSGYDPETWKPCPGRKPVRSHGHKYYWYCGPDHPDFKSMPAHEKWGLTAKKPMNPHKR